MVFQSRGESLESFKAELTMDSRTAALQKRFESYTKVTKFSSSFFAYTTTRTIDGDDL